MMNDDKTLGEQLRGWNGWSPKQNLDALEELAIERGLARVELVASYAGKIFLLALDLVPIMVKSQAVADALELRL